MIDNVKYKKIKITFIGFIVLCTFLYIVSNLSGNLVIKKGIVITYKVGIIDRIKNKIDIFHHTKTLDLKYAEKTKIG